MVRDKNGKWIDSSVFKQEALYFLKRGYYTSEPWGSPDWKKYWETQLERCKNGYEVDGHKITGHHYAYLNFSQIEVAQEISEGIAEKVKTFPDFWDGDYNYFWCLNIARYGILNVGLTTKEENKRILALPKKEQHEELLKVFNSLKLFVKVKPEHLYGGWHFIVGKSRRKGYSYKNGQICANIYNTVRNSLTIIGAFDKKYLYPEGTMGMSSNYINFINEHTGFRKSRDFVNKQDHRKASYESRDNGVIIEKGYLSRIMAVTFKDNPDAARGKDSQLVLFEEAGKFPNLEDAFNATKPGLTAGKYITGQIIIFGTGGDMENGTIDFAKMFYDPEAYDCMPFINIWDENAENTTCGFFHPVTWNFEGFYDEQGNSDIKAAEEYQINLRARLIERSSDSTLLQKHVQEYPLRPAESFLTVNINNFPVAELNAQKNRVIREKLHKKKGQPVHLLVSETGEIIAKPDLDNELQPIEYYKPKIENLSGAVVIYEYPNKDAPRGLYKIGYDPYAQDRSESTSLGAIYVFKTVEKGSYTKNILVARYIGRPQEADDVNRIAMLLAKLYNTEVMHENMFIHVKNFFRKKKELNRLAAQPDLVISKNIKHSTVSRVYGIHMDDKLKDAGEKYIKDWLLDIKDYNEHGDSILNLESIYDIGLLEELIQYNRKGNFDRVMALMMVMFQVEEEEENKIYDKETVNGNAKDLLSLIPNLYKNN